MLTLRSWRGAVLLHLTEIRRLGFLSLSQAAAGGEALKAVVGAAFRILYAREVVNVAARLTDKQKKAIIAERVKGASLGDLAKKYHVAKSTIARTCDRDPETVRKATAKKEANTLEMLAYMDAQKGKAQALLSKIIDVLGDPDKLARANVRDLATAYGIIADKFIQTAPTGGDDVLARAREILGGIDGVIK